MAASNAICWYENVGPRTFSRHCLSAATEAYGVATADVDGDDDLDIVSGEVAWYENVAGDASAWTRHLVHNYEKGVEVSVGDIDRDGDLDIAAVSMGDFTIGNYGTYSCPFLASAPVYENGGKWMGDCTGSLYWFENLCEPSADDDGGGDDVVVVDDDEVVATLPPAVAPSYEIYRIATCPDPSAAPTVVPTVSLAPTVPYCAHFANETCEDPMIVGYDYASKHACATAVQRRPECGDTFEYAESIGGCRCCDADADGDGAGDDDATRAPSVTPAPTLDADDWGIYMVSNCSDPTSAPTTSLPSPYPSYDCGEGALPAPRGRDDLQKRDVDRGNDETVTDART